MSKSRKPTVPDKPAFPRVIETFRRLDEYTINQFQNDNPSVWNSEVSVRRYRITIEEIEEPKEVIIERLQKLYNETTNHHHWMPLEAVARSYGVTLTRSLPQPMKGEG